MRPIRCWLGHDWRRTDTHIPVTDEDRRWDPQILYAYEHACQRCHEKQRWFARSRHAPYIPPGGVEVPEFHFPPTRRDRAKMDWYQQPCSREESVSETLSRFGDVGQTFCVHHRFSHGMVMRLPGQKWDFREGACRDCHCEEFVP